MCACNKKRERWIVKLPTGLKIAKASEHQARVFAEKHPGATYEKAA